MMKAEVQINLSDQAQALQALEVGPHRGHSLVRSHEHNQSKRDSEKYFESQPHIHWIS
jgi:hypothetical protein